MSIWSRLTNALTGDHREIDEELESHIEEAIAQGRDPAQARLAFGSLLRTREQSRDFKVLATLDALRADAVFGWRQLLKNKATSAAAILSLALAAGACTSAFRLIDALLLRPLPVKNPQELYEVIRQGTDFSGQPASTDSWAYPSFVRMRDGVRNQAELIAVSYADRLDLTFGSDDAMEKAQVQYVSGTMFPSFGLKPAAGRLFTPDDDSKPGGHPLAVLSYDYWTGRFGRDPAVIGKTFHIGNTVYEIIGVGPQSFTGTEPGTITAIFLPTAMHQAFTKDDWTWHRTLARVKPGIPLEPLRAKLDSISYAFEENRAKSFSGMTKATIAQYLAQKVALEHAPSGASDLQRLYRTSLLALGVLVALVLLIACANVANLMTAQAAARAREMALRVSIGAGRSRLIQLVLVESAWISFLAATIGGFFAWWSAPFVVSRINPPDNPARLDLPWDWRVLAFSLALTLTVTVLFGLTPALRASSVHPATALKGGVDPHRRHRIMHILIAAQVAFCFIVLFVSGLFFASFQRLSNRPTGFSADRILTVEAVSRSPLPTLAWEQLALQLRETTPGIDAIATTDSPILGGSAWNSFVSVNGASPSPVLAYLRAVSPGWIGAMNLTLIGGRDFRPSDLSPGAAIVNETFARQFFNGQNPVGKTFQRGSNRTPIEIVGLVRDAVYKSLRDPILPVAYLPFEQRSGTTSNATFIVRTVAPNPLALASALRNQIPHLRPGVRVSNTRTQLEINNSQTVRERLLAMIALFFATVALTLAAIGLFGVLNYGVLQRRRELGIRIALGAPASNIAGLVTRQTFAVVLTGAAIGLAAGLASVNYIADMFYDVKATDATMLLAPSLLILVAAMLASLPAVIHAVRIDPVKMLRSE